MAGFLDSLFALLGRKKPPHRPAPTPAPAPAPVTPTSTMQQELDSHNLYRSKQGKPPLTINAQLQAAAQAHADAQARRGKMGHDDVGDGTMVMRIAAVGYHYSRVGENVAMGQRGVASVMSAWMNSPGHRANILGPFTEAGLAVAYAANGTPFWTSIFGLPAAPGRFAAAGTFVAESSEPFVTAGHDSAASSIFVERILY